MKPCPPCTNNCNQGRDCPAPQACELPEADSERDFIVDFMRAIAAALGIFLVGFILLGVL